MPRDLLVLFCVFICTTLAFHSVVLPSLPESIYGFVGRKPVESRFLFVGDIMLARHVETLIKTEGAEYPFVGLVPLRDHYDAMIGNFEAPIGLIHTQTKANSLSFSVASSSIAHLGDYFDLVSLANNHTLDQGEAGLVYTRELLESKEARPFGDPAQVSIDSVAYLTHKEERLAVVGLNATKSLSYEALERLFAELREHSSMQIVYVHWGIEYDNVHAPEQETLAHFLIDHGADVIIGHHPHVIQDIGFYKGAPIFYSLGNFVFDQYFSDEVEVGLGVELALVDQTVSYRLIPFTSQKHQSSPRLMPYDERVALVESILERSGPEVAQIMNTDGILEITKTLASL
mgnify:FL=1